MNKGLQFWLDSWQQGVIPFHKEEVQPDLIAYWPALNVKAHDTVLVPLCGKSLDMLWLAQQGVNVVGIEFSEQAVQHFFAEHQLPVQQQYCDGLTRYYTDTISIWVGDIFNVSPTLIPQVDAIYDRAALVALPPGLRSAYVATCMQWLKPTGAVLLKTLCYQQDDVQGPPYSVVPAELRSLYEQTSEIRCLKTVARDSRLISGQNILIDEYLWCITK